MVWLANTRSAGKATGVLSLTMVVWACASSTEAGPFVRSDSLGVSLVTYAPSFAAAVGSKGMLEARPALSIEHDSLGLYGVRSVRLLGDGGLVVLNGGTQELLIFDAEAQLLARVGGEGGGPGEFRQATHLFVGEDDSLFAFDSRSRRISVFDRHGVFARIVTLQGADTLGPLIRFGVLANGKFVGAFHQRTPGSGLVRDSVMVAAYRGSGDFSEMLGVFPHMYTHWGPHQIPGSEETVTFPAPVPLSSLTSLAVGRTSIYVGLADRFAIMRIDIDGRRRITQQEELPARLLDSHRSELFAVLAARGRDGPEEELLRALSGPTVVPAFGAEPLTQGFLETIVVTDSESIWIKPFQLVDSAASEWPRFNASGLYQGTVTVHGRFRPTAVRGDIVVGVYKDQSDVESVRGYRLRNDDLVK